VIKKKPLGRCTQENCFQTEGGGGKRNKKGKRRGVKKNARTRHGFQGLNLLLHWGIILGKEKKRHWQGRRQAIKNRTEEKLPPHAAIRIRTSAGDTKTGGGRGFPVGAENRNFQGKKEEIKKKGRGN